MQILDKKVFREIWRQKLRSILVIVIISSTIAILAGLRASKPMMVATYEANLIESNVADARYNFNAPIHINNITAIKSDTSFMDQNHIAELEGRLWFTSEIEYNDENFPAIVIGIDYPNDVNKIKILQTSPDTSESSLNLANNTAIMETHFTNDLIGQSFAVDDNFTLFLGTDEYEMTATAIGQDSDFVYVVDPNSGISLFGQMAIIWVDLAFLQAELFAGAPVINQVLFTVEDRLNKDQIFTAREALNHRFVTNGVDENSLPEFILYDDTVERDFFDADVGSVDKFGTIFGIIGLIVCAIAIYNTLSRIVQSQRRNIGLFMSMGVKKGKIVSHYMKITSLLGIIGTFVGIVLAHVFAIGLTQLTTRFFAFSVYDYSLGWNIWLEYIIGGTITLILSVAISVFSAIPITQVTPKSAMSAHFNRIKVTTDPVSERLFGWIPGLRSIRMKVPLREIFLRKRKSALSISAIVTSMLILIVSVSMLSNMYSTITDNYDEYNIADYQVQFVTPIDSSAIDSFMDGLTENQIEIYEKYIVVPTALIDGSNTIPLLLEVYQENSTLRNINVIEGKDTNELTNTSILLGQTIARDNDLVIGDMVYLEGVLENYTVSIDGLVGEMIDKSAFWTIKEFESANMTANFGFSSGQVNGIIFTINENSNIDELRNLIEAQFPVAIWTDNEKTQDSIMALIQSMIGVLIMFVGVGMLITVIFSFNTMYMGFIARENDFLAFKAMGTPMNKIRRMIFAENVLLSVFSLLLSIPVGYVTYRSSMQYMLGDRFYLPISIPWFVWPVVFVLSLISIWLATQRMTKKIKKMELANELRMRIVS